MRKALGGVLIATLLLGGCSAARESRLNPFNWFGADAAAEPGQAAPAPTRAADPRPLVADIVSARLEPIPGGAILHAVGLPPAQGYWQADLVEEPGATAGRRIYSLRAQGPLVARPAAGPARAREITAALFLSDQALAGLREIVVEGATGSRRLRP